MRTVFALAIVLVGCRPQAPEDTGLLPPGPGCLRVESTLLHANPDATLVLRNPCDGEATVDAFVLSDEAPFTLDLPDTPLVLASQDAVDIPVHFDPLAGTDKDGEVRAQSSVGDVVVALVSDIDVPRVDVASAVDLGDVQVSCSISGEVEVRNVGSGILDVAAEVGAPFVLADGPTFALGPNQSRSIGLAWTPHAAGDGDASLVLTTNDPRRPEALVVLTATANGGAIEQDLPWDQRGLVDLVVPLSDRSGSNLDEALQALEHFHYFLDEAAAVELRWRMLVPTQGDGCVLGDVPFIDESFAASEAAASFEYMVDYNYAHSTYGIWDEAEMTVLDHALVDDEGCNVGFRRDGALLAALFISDEPDQSLVEWSDFVDRWQHLAPDGLVLSAVTGNVPDDGCERAEPGYGYWEAREATHGMQVDLCATAPLVQAWMDWPVALHAWSRGWPLPADPDLDSVLLLDADGAPVEFVWNADQGRIDVADGQERHGLRIAYYPQAECDPE